MNEREVLELLRRVIECGDFVGRLGMLAEIERRLSALPASEAQSKHVTFSGTADGGVLAATVHPPLVGWNMPPAPSPQPEREAQDDDRFADGICSKACVPIGEREAQGEPTLEEITSLVHGGEIQTHEAWARCPECRPRAEEIRSLLLAHRAPSPSPSLAAIVEAGDAMRDEVMRFCTAAVNGVNSIGGIDALIKKRIRYDDARASLPKEGAR